MPAKQIEVGQRFGRLVVKAPLPKIDEKGLLFLCECDCGTEHTTRGFLLRNGQTQSCGCLQREWRTSENRRQRMRDYRLRISANNPNDPASCLHKDGLTIAQANSVTCAPWGATELLRRYAG